MNRFRSSAWAQRLPARKAWLACGLAGALALTFFALSASAQSASPKAAKHADAKPTIVLVHGAWADASGWSGVISRLERAGYPVVAPANPLRSLSGDAAYLAGFLAQTPGPIVLVGHSYGGAVISAAAAGNANVKALVYVDAFVPEVGEDIFHLAGAESQVAAALDFKKYPPFGENDVDVYIQRAAFREVFAADVPAAEVAVMAATQRPIALAAGAEPASVTAWKSIPSWYLLGLDDHTITPAAQLFMAERAGSHIVKIHSSHVAMVSHPAAVTKLIKQAARATG